MHSFLRHSFSTKITLALSTGLGILFLLGAFGLYGVGEFFNTGREVRRLLQVIKNLEEIGRDIERTQGAQLRYQLTREPSDLDAFRASTLLVSGQIAGVRRLLVAPDQIDRLDRLDRAAQAQFGALAAAMVKPGSAGAGTKLLIDPPGVEIGKEMHQDIDAIVELERRLVRENAERVENLVRLLVAFALCGGAIAVALLLWTLSHIVRYQRDRTRTESDLASAKERLAFALQGSKSAAWDWDLPRNEVYLSAGWTQMLGAEARESEMTPAALLALVHPADVGRVEAAIKGALTGATADYREEHRVKRVDGTWIWILSRGKVVRHDEKGRPVRITGTNQDITERKAIELELQEHDLGLQLALATANMVRWDWDVVADQFVWTEDPSHLLGSAPQGGYLGLQDMVHPEDLVHFISTLNHVVRTGAPYKDEYRLTCTDGTIVWVLARGDAVRDADGKVVRVIGIAQNVSENKRAEQALKASERELRLIMDSMPAFVGYTDIDETLQFCNRALAKFMGARPKDLIGRQLSQIYGEEVYRVIQPYSRRALAGETVHFQRRQTTRNGDAIDLDVIYIPRHGPLGEVQGFYSLLTDITELKRLDRMKSEFVSTVSHELRTPLTSIRGSLGILAGGVAGPLSDKVRGFIDIARDNCERLIRLINDILDMEKIESGKMTFQLQVLDLMDLIEKTLKANEGFAAQHGVRLQLVASLPGIKANADSDRLAQVLTNLISNACKFSPAQSSVDIAVSEHDRQIRVEVIDHGPGISEVFRQRIFQKFSQEDSSDMRQKGGTGLGLSISKAIVEGLGGAIGFDTEVGKGSTFYFQLPRWHEENTLQAAAPPARPRLLVCGNDIEAGNRLQSMADKAGYDSDVVRTAAEARLLLRDGLYNAMTVDLSLSDQDTLSLMRELRANPATDALPVIVLYANEELGGLVSGSGSFGIVDWSSKPIDEQRLLTDLQFVGHTGARPRILHVEDDADVRKVVCTIAQDIAEFEAAGSVAEARAKLEREQFDLVLLDLGLPDGSGWDLLPLINGLVPPVRVVIFTARDATRGSGTLPYTFLVKSQTSEQRLIEVIREAIKIVA